jgi:hypothetical protein
MIAPLTGTNCLVDSIRQSWRHGGEELMLMHEEHLMMLVHHDLSGWTQDQIEDIQHRLVHAGWTDRVYQGAMRALKRASLFLNPDAFARVCSKLDCVCSPLKRRCVASFSFEVRRGIYARPVARRWRRAFRFLLWVARIPKWLPAFNEAAFRPDAAAVERVAKRFKLAAAAL